MYINGDEAAIGLTRAKQGLKIASEATKGGKNPRINEKERENEALHSCTDP